jgi:hypothetical protein
MQMHIYTRTRAGASWSRFKEIARDIKREQHRAAARGDRRACAMIVSARRTAAERRRHALATASTKVPRTQSRQTSGSPKKVAAAGSSSGGDDGGDGGSDDDGDGPLARLERFAGLKRNAIGAIESADSEWKSADAAFFAANPSRNHRLRRCFENEFESLPNSSKLPPAPFGHAWEILIRKIGPGLRVRMPFCRDLRCQIPDREAYLRALFDIAAQGGEGPIPTKTVAARARQYIKTGRMS